MEKTFERALLIGDNPFHNISHLSQERMRLRGSEISSPEHAADLVSISCESGANGFMFSVSETTLAILKEVRSRGAISQLGLYPIVPYAFEYVQLATQLGGIPGLAKHFAGQILKSHSPSLISAGLKGVAFSDPVSLMKAYLLFEISRIKSSAGKQANIDSLFLHEIITDMALALNLDWFINAYVHFLLKRGITPGFNTCNLTYLIEKLKDWKIDLARTYVAVPLNSVGFQMNPSKEECERTLSGLPEPIVIAISILAAGYLKPPRAIEYISGLPNVKGVAVGVSKETHARETFKMLKEQLR